MALKAERRQRAVVGPAAGDAGLEQVGVGEQIGRHIGTVAVAAQRHTLRVDNAQLLGLVDDGARVHGDLLDKAVVDGFRVPHHRHGGVAESTLNTGTYTVRASYGGDSNYSSLGATAPLSVIINKATVLTDASREGPHLR